MCMTPGCQSTAVRALCGQGTLPAIGNLSAPKYSFEWPQIERHNRREDGFWLDLKLRSAVS